MEWALVVCWQVLLGADGVFSGCITMCCVPGRPEDVEAATGLKMALSGCCQSAYSAGSPKQRYCSGGTSSSTRTRAPAAQLLLLVVVLVLRCI